MWFHVCFILDYEGMTLMDLLKQYLSHVQCVPSSPYHTLLQTESNHEETLLNTEGKKYRIHTYN